MLYEFSVITLFIPPVMHPQGRGSRERKGGLFFYPVQSFHVLGSFSTCHINRFLPYKAKHSRGDACLLIDFIFCLVSLCFFFPHNFAVSMASVVVTIMI